MKYYCYTKVNQSPVNDKTILITYNDVTFIKGLGKLLEIINKGDTVIFKDINELYISTNENDDMITTITNNYIKLLKLGAVLMFDRSPNCDSEVIYETVSELKEKNILNAKDDVAYSTVLALQIQAYMNIKGALSSERARTVKASSMLNSTSYGRPKGTTRETVKAINTKKIILKYSKDFGGNKSENECIKISGVSRNSYYIYKNELLKEKKKHENI